MLKAVRSAIFLIFHIFSLSGQAGLCSLEVYKAAKGENVKYLFAVVEWPALQSALNGWSGGLAEVHLPHPRSHASKQERSHLFIASVHLIGTSTDLFLSEIRTPSGGGLVTYESRKRAIVMIHPRVLGKTVWELNPVASLKHHGSSITNELTSDSSITDLASQFLNVANIQAHPSESLHGNRQLFTIVGGIPRSDIIGFIVQPEWREAITPVINESGVSAEKIHFVDYFPQYLYGDNGNDDLPHDENAKTDAMGRDAERLASTYLQSALDNETAIAQILRTVCQLSENEAQAWANGIMSLSTNYPSEIAWYFRYENDYLQTDDAKAQALQRLRDLVSQSD